MKRDEQIEIRLILKSLLRESDKAAARAIRVALLIAYHDTPSRQIEEALGITRTRVDELKNMGFNAIARRLYLLRLSKSQYSAKTARFLKFRDLEGAFYREIHKSDSDQIHDIAVFEYLQHCEEFTTIKALRETAPFPVKRVIDWGEWQTIEDLREWLNYPETCRHVEACKRWRNAQAFYYFKGKTK